MTRKHAKLNALIEKLESNRKATEERLEQIEAESLEQKPDNATRIEELNEQIADLDQRLAVCQEERARIVNVSRVFALNPSQCRWHLVVPLEAQPEIVLFPNQPSLCMFRDGHSSRTRG